MQHFQIMLSVVRIVRDEASPNSLGCVPPPSSPALPSTTSIAQKTAKAFSLEYPVNGNSLAIGVVRCAVERADVAQSVVLVAEVGLRADKPGEVLSSARSDHSQLVEVGEGKLLGPLSVTSKEAGLHVAGAVLEERQILGVGFGLRWQRENNGTRVCAVRIDRCSIGSIEREFRACVRVDTKSLDGSAAMASGDRGVRVLSGMRCDSQVEGSRDIVSLGHGCSHASAGEKRGGEGNCGCSVHDGGDASLDEGVGNQNLA